jgi:WS/DGAT/MGAT family acyltransferase
MKALSGIDSAFLSLETPTTPMNIVGAILLDPSTAPHGCSFDSIRALVKQRVPRLAPFRRRLVEMPFGVDHPVWIEDPDFDLDHHVHLTVLDPPGAEADLAQVVARLASQPLDRSRPLWQLWVVEGLEENRLAIIIVSHHAIADGASGAELLMQFFDLSPEPAGDVVQADPWWPEAVPSAARLLAEALGRLVERPAHVLRTCTELGRTAGRLSQLWLDSEGGGSSAWPFAAPRVPWNAALSRERAVAYGRARLADLKRVKAVFGGTVNDAVLAASTGALRGYLQARGALPDAPLVATVPVSVRGDDQRGTHGNHISAMFAHLPVHLEHPLAQLLVIRRQMRSAKRVHEAIGDSALASAAELASPVLLAAAARLYTLLLQSRLGSAPPPIHNLIISNVMGPPVPLYTAGARVTAVHPHGPAMEGAGMNITVLSYVDSVDFGVMADAQSVPDVHEIARGFERAVAELAALADERSAPAGDLEQMVA